MIKERSRRIPVEMGCWLEGEGGVSCVTILDLSETGISVASSHPLPDGRIITLKVYTPFAAEAFSVKAEVVWSRTEPEGGMGLRFLDVDEKTRGVLKGMVQLMRAHGKDRRKS
jgi:hypothetical protein